MSVVQIRIAKIVPYIFKYVEGVNKVLDMAYFLMSVKHAINQIVLLALIQNLHVSLV